MDRLILVRHGFPDHMLSGYTGGWTDSHLTDLGQLQAQRAAFALAERLEGGDFAFHTSDLSRTVETAKIIGRHLHATPIATAALREQNLGSANSKTVVQAARMALEPANGPVVDRVFFPGAETWRQMMHRVFGFLDGINKDPQPTHLIVSHAGAGNCVIFWWLRLQATLWPAIQFELDLCSITELTVGEFHGRRILCLNDTHHLTTLEP